MKSRKKLVMAFLCLAMNASAQNIKTLSIGDTVPDITLNHIINYKTSSAKLSDFGNKPIIIDFFATWCSGCISALPHLDSLQKRFGDSAEVFVVTYESKKQLLNFLSNNTVAKQIKLSFIFEDTLLKSLFPHKLIPHEVIIQNQQVKAVTYPEYLTEETLNTLLSNTELHIPEKRDLVQYNNELSIEENGDVDKEIIFHSLLTRYLEGFGFRGRLSSTNGRKKLSFINSSIISLYLRATNTYQKIDQRNRILLEVKKPEKLFMPTTVTNAHEWHAWATKHCYSYELLAPVSTSDRSMKKMMLHDLNRFFPLNGRVEKRKVKCIKLIFSSTADIEKIKSDGGQAVVKLTRSDSPKVIKNSPFSVLLAAINRQPIPLPLVPIVIDGTEYTGNINLSLDIKDIQDLPSLRKALAPYGLKLVPTETYMDILVISDK